MKAAGVDIIPAELLQAVEETMINVLTEFVTRSEEQRIAYTMDSVPKKETYSSSRTTEISASLYI